VTEIVAFTADHVCRLTGLSSRQIRYWDATDFFSPTLLDDFKRRAFGRIYSFRDVVGLRTIAILRNKHQVPLQELRRVGAWLKERHEEPWSSLRFALHGRRVVFLDPQSDEAVEPRGAGQEVLAVSLEPIANNMRSAADRLKQRSRSEIGRIVKNRYVVHNASVIAGTRIPTTAIWNFHVAGYSARAIVTEYPRLTTKDVRVAIAFEKRRHVA
jgi:uncharacterized protein (DUF433 family)